MPNHIHRFGYNEESISLPLGLYDFSHSKVDNHHVDTILLKLEHEDLSATDLVATAGAIIVHIGSFLVRPKSITISHGEITMHMPFGINHEDGVAFEYDGTADLAGSVTGELLPFAEFIVSEHVHGEIAYAFNPQTYDISGYKNDILFTTSKEMTVGDTTGWTVLNHTIAVIQPTADKLVLKLNEPIVPGEHIRVEYDGKGTTQDKKASVGIQPLLFRAVPNNIT